MSDKAFLDTNILVYAFDQHDPHKQRKAQELISKQFFITKTEKTEGENLRG